MVELIEKGVKLLLLKVKIQLSLLKQLVELGKLLVIELKVFGFIKKIIDSLFDK